MIKNLFLVLFAFPTLLFSQKQVTAKTLLQSLQLMKEDTLKVNQLLRISEHYAQSNYPKAIIYGQKAIQLSKKIKWNQGVADASFQLGVLNYQQLNYESALTYFKQSLKTTDDKKRGTSLQNMGEVYLKTGDFSKALDYCFKALKINETLGNKKGNAKVYANIGSVYFAFQKYSKALGYYDKAVKLYDTKKPSRDLAIVNRNIAVVYTSLKRPEKALFYHEKANAICKKIKDKALEARILSDISLVYYNSGQYDLAIKTSYSSLKLVPKTIDEKQTKAFSYGVLGDCYLEKARLDTRKTFFLDSAIVYLNKAKALHMQLNSSRDLAYDYSSITQVYKLRGDYKSALASYETAMVYEDSVFNSENKETIKSLEDKRTIELREREIKIKKLQLEAKEKQKWILLSGLALLGIIGGLLFYQSSNRRRMNKKLQTLNLDLEKKNLELDEANKIKARFFSILNHDLRSPVYNLIHFLHLQKDNPELMDEEMKMAIEKKTVTSAENLLTSMEDMLLWSKSQIENFNPQPKKMAVASLFEDTEKHFSSEEKIKIIFENPDNIELITDEDYLKTILRNLTGNAIKALSKTENPTIVWKAWQENGTSYLSITDNGSGASQEQFKALYDDKEVVGIKTGLGLHLIRDLAKAIHCTISVDSKVGIGTTFTLALP